MPTMKDIANMGLGKLGASRVNNLAPPISVLENKVASEYVQWRQSELKKRRWTFATEITNLSSVATITDPGDGRIYKFNKPGNHLRSIRPKNCTWVERGQFIYNTDNTITGFEYIKDVPDNELSDSNFIDVLAARVAVECAELATQSPGKKRDALVMLKDAEDEAGRLNAFVLEPHQTEGDDWAYTWDRARLDPEIWSG